MTRRHKHKWSEAPTLASYCDARLRSGENVGMLCWERAAVVCEHVDWAFTTCGAARCPRHRPRTRDAQTTGRRRG